LTLAVVAAATTAGSALAANITAPEGSAGRLTCSGVVPVAADGAFSVEGRRPQVKP
jgi:hypothetical protein